MRRPGKEKKFSGQGTFEGRGKEEKGGEGSMWMWSKGRKRGLGCGGRERTKVERGHVAREHMWTLERKKGG